MRGPKFFLWLLIAAAIVFGVARLIDNAYVFFAGYVVLQYIALATAWNILGGYTGYVNFGTAAFFALGAYTTVALHKLTSLPLPLMMPIGGLVSGIVGLGTGYLTLRLRGAFFSIATLALAVVAQTLITNWNFVGGSRGAYIVRPATTPLFGIDYIQYLFLIMLALVVIVLATARAIERSRLGYGFATIRDDEVAAEASGVPTLRLKLLATTLVWRLHGDGRCAAAVLCDVSRSGIRVQPGLCGERRGDAAGGRDIKLAWSGDRGDPAGHAAAGGHGDDLIGAEFADCRIDAGGLRHRRAEWHFGIAAVPERAGMIRKFNTEEGRGPRRATEKVENALRAERIHSVSVTLRGPPLPPC